MLQSQEEQEERRATLDNDRRVREQQGGTYLSHTHNDLAGGRFAAVGAQTIVGQSPNPYPAASAHQRDPVPDEPPLSQPSTC